YFKEFQAKVDLRSIWESRMTVNGLVVEDGKIFIKRNADSTTNFTFLQNYFAPEKKIDDKSKKKFDFILPDATLKNIDFRYKNYFATHDVEGINFNDIHISALSGKFTEIDYVNHVLQSSIKDLTFKEKSGIFVKNLSTKATVDSNRMEFSQLDLAVNSSY